MMEMSEVSTTSYSNQGFDENEEPQVSPFKATSYREKKVEIPEDDIQEERGTWSNQCDFFLSALGYAVGLGNVWRFPYLAYLNGGGSFLIPYTFMLTFAGLPLFFMELALGQYSGCGPTRLFGRMAPAFKGLGFAMIAATFYVAIYYNMIIAWTIFYMFAGFQTELPWSHCNPTYSSHRCFEGNSSAKLPDSGLQWSPPEDFFNTVMLGLNPDVHNWMNFGDMHWELVLCLLAAWVIVCLSLIKGVQSSGKVVYFTALFPYVVLVILFIVGLTLPGAADGIYFYVTPDFEKLKDINVWAAAANQIFYSLGPTFGGLITLSSYNNFNNNCHRDALLISLCNCATSVFAGFVVFSILGYMANNMSIVENRTVSIGDVVQSGPALAFVAYPDAVSNMEFFHFAPQIMSFLFFFMLLTLGLDSMFAMVETLTTAILDHFRALRKFKEWVVVTCCVFGFICGLSFCTSGGIFMFTLIDSMSASWNILLFACIEVILVSWVYGVDNFFGNIQEMGIHIPIPVYWYWRICWQFVTPVILAILVIYSFVQYRPVQYGLYVFEGPVQGLGWILGISSTILIPIVGCWNIYKRYRNGKPVGRTLFRPTPKWRPANGELFGTSRDNLAE